jgi:hypothetical protein
VGESVRTRREPDRQRDRDGQRQSRRHEPQSTGIDRDRQDAPGRQRHPSSAAVCEVQGADEQRQRRGRQCTPDHVSLRRREPERQQRPECRQQPQPVPVADRCREPVPAEDVGRELAREQPRRKRVGADPRECGEQAPKQQPDRLAPGEQEESGGAGHVQERALNLVDRLGRAGGPGEGQCNPAGEGAENPEQRQLGARERDVGREGQRESRRPGKPQRPPVPRAREVGALGRGEGGCRHCQPGSDDKPIIARESCASMTRRRSGCP